MTSSSTMITHRGRSLWAVDVRGAQPTIPTLFVVINITFNQHIPTCPVVTTVLNPGPFPVHPRSQYPVPAASGKLTIPLVKVAALPLRWRDSVVSPCLTQSWRSQPRRHYTPPLLSTGDRRRGCDPQLRRTTSPFLAPFCRISFRFPTRASPKRGRLLPLAIYQSTGEALSVIYTR